MNSAFQFLGIFLNWFVKVGIDFGGIRVTFGAIILFCGLLFVVVKIYRALVSD